MTTSVPPPAYTRLVRGEGALRESSGVGVRVAVLDSGINRDHPHLRDIAGTYAIKSACGEDWCAEGEVNVTDLLGHGTAVTAAIQEKAPEASIHAVKIFHQTLSTDAAILLQAVDRASDLGVQLINLSLGTAEPRHRPRLEEAVRRAQQKGTIVVSALEHRGKQWWPGSVRGAAGVLLDWGCPRNELRVMRDPQGLPVFRASGFPRPIDGVPPSRNIKGISFAVANTTGILACLLEARPELRTPEAIANYLGN